MKLTLNINSATINQEVYFLNSNLLIVKDSISEIYTTCTLQSGKDPVNTIRITLKGTNITTKSTVGLYTSIRHLLIDIENKGIIAATPSDKLHSAY